MPELYIIKPDGDKRIIDYEELNQLKKDILWIYDENFGQINCAFVPDYSFKMKYWEYLTLNESGVNKNVELEFYRIGSLITILCQCVEYIDIAGGNQSVLEKHEIETITNYVERFNPIDEQEIKLKSKILLGLRIAQSITEEQLIDSEFEHELNSEFFNDLNSLGNDFIRAYYDKKCN